MSVAGADAAILWRRLRRGIPELLARIHSRGLLLGLAAYQQHTAIERGSRSRDLRRTVAGVGSQENAQSVRRYWDELWSKGNLDVAADFYAPTYRENGVELTPQEFAKGARSWMDKFEDFSVEVQKLLTCGDNVIVSRVRYRAKHVGDFKAVPATGKTTDMTGIDIFDFDENGRVVDHWHEADHLLLFQQLGAELRPKAP